jgi:hypothetical protein
MGTPWCPGHRDHSAVRSQDDSSRPLMIARTSAYQLEPDRPTITGEFVLSIWRRVVMARAWKADDAHTPTVGRAAGNRLPNETGGLS